MHTWFACVQFRYRALAHENSVNIAMSNWGKKMVDLWHNKDLVPDVRVDWKQFYIESFKDMNLDGAAEHEDVVRGVRRQVGKGRAVLYA